MLPTDVSAGSVLRQGSNKGSASLQASRTGSSNRRQVRSLKEALALIACAVQLRLAQRMLSILRQLTRWVARFHDSKGTVQAGPSRKSEAEPLGYCLVANVAADLFGEARTTGTKHFTAGTKVYCEPPQWGDGYERIWVVGRHRKSSRLIRIVMPADRLANWRVKPLYDRSVYHKIKHPWAGRADAESWASQLEQHLPSSESTVSVQAQGRLMSDLYQRLENEQQHFFERERQAVTALSAFTPADWQHHPGGPIELQQLLQELEIDVAQLPPKAVAAIIVRKARRKSRAS